MEQQRTGGMATQLEELCDICRHPVIQLHCKIRCLNCGYLRDCSDP